MRTAEEAILAIDLGTSSVKTLIVARSGSILGRGQASYPTSHPRDGFDEQHPDDWFHGIVAATTGARRFAPLATIDAIAITGQMHGTVMLDRDRLPLHSAVIWSDRRSAELLTEIGARLGTALAATIGGPLSTGYQATTLAWFQQHRPHLWHEIRHVLLPTDYIGLLLTGAIATDPSNAVSTGLFASGRGDWDTAVLAQLEIPAEWLPTIVPTGSQVGLLAPAMAEILELPRQCPVYLAGGDAPVAAVGGGVLTAADAMIVMSTGAQVTRPAARYAPHPGGSWHTWPSARPLGADGAAWIDVGATLSGGRAIAWVHRLLAPQSSLSDFIALADAAPVGSGNLLFLPYLAGERSPLNDPLARGAFIGLGEGHGPEHHVRAVLEGIALSLADVLDRMTQGRDRPERIVLGGGGASRDMRQLMASVLGIPLTIPPSEASSALGATMVGAHALGWRRLGSGDGATAERLVVYPVASDHERYRERLELFREAATATLPLMHRLQRPAP